MIPVWKYPLVAFDIRTTGADPERHEICQLAAVPLNSEYQPAAAKPYLILNICPDFRDTVDFSHMTKFCQPYEQLILSGCSQADAIRLWRDWRDQISKMPILPLAYRWHKILPFLLKFLGEDIFTEPVRDLQSYLAYVHDRHWFAQYNPGFTSFTRQKLYECCKVPCLDLKDPMLTCLADAQCFRMLLTHPLP